MRLALVTVLLAAIGAGPAQARAARPDLVVTRTSIGTVGVRTGGTMKVGDATTNVGRAVARPSATAYFLSADRVRSAGDFKLASRKLGRLRKGSTSRGQARVTIPPSLTPGPWAVIACADARRRVREASERNNCRSSRYLTVRGASPPGGGRSGSPIVRGCRIFPADSPWNRDISRDPVDPLSDTYIRYMGASPGADWTLRQDWGTGEEPFYGIPWVVVPAAQPLVPITFDPGDNAADESDRGPFPFPLDIPIEGGSPGNPDPAEGDRHAIALQQGGSCTLYETYSTTRTRDGFQVYSAARFDLGSNATRPQGWTSADAAGLPIFPGLAKYEEVAAGSIAHALRFTAPRVQRSYVAPAVHYGTQENACYPPYGARVRLKASFDLNRLSGQARVLGEALRKYGLILADQGSAGYISGTSDAGWNMDELRQLREIHGSDLEVVETGPITPYRWSPPANPSC